LNLKLRNNKNKKLIKLNVVSPIKHKGRISFESSNNFGFLTCLNDFNIFYALPTKSVATAITPSKAAFTNAGTRLLIPV
jgi:hypothetical protein